MALLVQSGNSSSIQAFNKCLGKDNGLITMSGLKLNMTFASKSTSYLSASFCILLTSNMPGSVNVKSNLNCLRFFLYASPCSKYCWKVGQSNPVLMYSPMSPVPSILAHICQSRMLLNMSRYKLTPL